MSESLDTAQVKTRRARPRGTGSVYQQQGSANWWIQYYRNGKVYRQSARTPKRREAEKLLQKKLGEIATHNFIEPRSEKILVKELADDLLREYKINNRKSLDDLKTRWKKHLSSEFGDLRAAHVGNDHLTRYIAKRQQEEASNATINRELAALKRMFSLGVRARKVYTAPSFPHLEERNVRKGFVEDAQYEALASACAVEGLWLRAMFEVAYNFGWRVSELQKLRVRQIDLIARTIRLEPGETKNDEGRTVVMTGIISALLQQCVVGKQPEDCVFTRSHGKPVRDFRGAWAKVCTEAKVPELLFHDLRRTAVRNMVRRGIPERVAMTISGHKTRAVFDRYNIVSESDLRDAAVKLERDYSHRTDIVERSEQPIAARTNIN